MAQEWKKNEHYVANNTTIGDNIPVEELDDDEYNEIFDRDAFGLTSMPYYAFQPMFACQKAAVCHKCIVRMHLTDDS
eukprot:s7034_g1.t1